MANTKVVVVLDIDGTLLDSSALHQTAAQQAMAPFALDPNSRPLESYRNFTDLDVFDELLTDLRGRNADPSELSTFEKDLGKYFEDLAAGGLEEIPGATVLLRDLFAHDDIQPVFATGSSRHAAAIKLRHFGLDASKILIRTGSDFRRREDVVYQVMRDAISLHGPDLNVISIGDGLWDEKTAANLGIPFIGIGGDPSRFQLETTWTAPDFSDLSIERIIALSRPYAPGSWV